MNARRLSRSSAEIDLCRPLNSISEFGSLMTIEIERSEVVLLITHTLPEGNGTRERGFNSLTDPRDCSDMSRGKGKLRD
jgi:putative heme iron utilization protein